MRNLSRPKKRCCPVCLSIGFALIGKDFFGRPEFECNDCRHVWATDHGPQKGTSLHRLQPREDSDA